MEGQMDFLGLLNEYRDDQGAVVRVREPKEKRVKPKASFFEKGEVKAEQLSFDFTLKQSPLETKQEEKEPEIPEEVIEKEPEIPAEQPSEEVKENPLAETKEILFKQCKKCWCFDCRHNSRNQGVPREMCGKRIPCPACDGCVNEDMATVCEIGNAKEGCKLRAQEEGILTQEDGEEV